MDAYHKPVLLEESISGLITSKSGTYVDVTFGGGGHSQEILDRLSEGHLFAFDQDEDASQNAQKLTEAHRAEERKSSFTFIESNFRYLKKYLRVHGITAVDGILADLGVSSYQFNTPERGFTTRFDGQLDMRMDTRQKLSAIEVINDSEEPDLIHYLSAYGEVRNARSLASAIITARMAGRITTIAAFKEIVAKLAPRGRENKYLAQVFQAIRIVVNDEMAVLKDFLTQAGELLKPGGRLAIISYHSLEDRLVKNFINKGNFKGMDEKDFYGNPIRILDPVTRKPIVPSEAEINENGRARSAKLRIGIKTQSM